VRTICRRAERTVCRMAAETEIAPWIIKYLNRLSDYFFVLSRHLSKYFGIDEIPWTPKL
jgi:cob(I)alamin adenosyltransferase